MPIPRVYYSNIANIALCVEKIESQEGWGYIGYIKLKDSEKRGEMRSDVGILQGLRMCSES